MRTTPTRVRHGCFRYRVAHPTFISDRRTTMKILEHFPDTSIDANEVRVFAVV